MEDRTSETLATKETGGQILVDLSIIETEQNETNAELDLLCYSHPLHLSPFLKTNI